MQMGLPSTILIKKGRLAIDTHIYYYELSHFHFSFYLNLFLFDKLFFVLNIKYDNKYLADKVI